MEHVIYHQRSAEATVNEDRALMRFELLEALLRVAITMRDNEGEEEMSPADKARPSDVYACHTLRMCSPVSSHNMLHAEKSAHRYHIARFGVILTGVVFVGHTYMQLF